MADGLNILFTCVGRRVSLLRQFRRALEDLGVPGRIIGTDWSPLAPAYYVADEAFIVPGVNAPNYVDALVDVVRRRAVSLVIPLIDWELSLLAEARERFREAGARVLVSNTRITDICRDKDTTCTFLAEHGLGTPRILSHKEAAKGPFPVILKARYGSSAKNVHEVHSARGLQRLGRRGEDIVIQEYVKGPEYTVDVYADFAGRPRVAVPRERLQVRAGEVAKARTVRDANVIRESLRLVEALGECVGVITCQCRVTNGSEVKFFDLNPRFGGGVPLAIEAGADFPRWIIQEALGRTPEIDSDGWRDGLYMLRYDAEVFRHVDDMPEP